MHEFNKLSVSREVIKFPGFSSHARAQRGEDGILPTVFNLTLILRVEGEVIQLYHTTAGQIDDILNNSSDKRQYRVLPDPITLNII